MRIETSQFALELPAGYVDRSNDDCISYVSELDQREISITTGIKKPELPVDVVLQGLTEARMAPDDQADPVRFGRGA